jgi:hypothetical protein
MAFLSGSNTLPAGTVILTGTPHGVGMASKPPALARVLRPSDYRKRPHRQTHQSGYPREGLRFRIQKNDLTGSGLTLPAQCVFTLYRLYP